MFSLPRPVTDRRYVQEGRVFCPARGRDVEFDLCASCARASEVRLSYVRCRPEPVLPILLPR